MPSSALGAVRLADWGVIRAQGEEAAKFLHTQLTQDLALQTTAQARLAGYCSAKGRLLATLLALKPDDRSVLLALPADVLPATVKRLSMFVLRAKCQLSDDSAAWAVWGLSGAQARDWLAEAAPADVWSVGRLALADGRLALATRLPDDGLTPRFLLLQPADAPAPALPVIDPEEWQGLDVTAGLAWIRQGTVEQFVPQMLNLEVLGGVNFQKGCYPGQEVVARSQYRGTIKRRTHLFAMEGSDADATPGQENYRQGVVFYSNSELDGILEEARYEMDPAARQELYNQAGEIIYDEVPQLPLFQRMELWGVSNRVQGFTPPVDHRFWLYDVTVSE